MPIVRFYLCFDWLIALFNWLIAWLIALHVFLASCYHSRFVFTTLNQITIVESVLWCLLTVVFWLGVRSREAMSSKGERVPGLQGTTTDKT